MDGSSSNEELEQDLATLHSKARYTNYQVMVLVNLRWSFRHNRSEKDDLPLDERRLKFARWLVNHGKLSENV